MMYSSSALRPGMVLQEPVRDANGQVLLPAAMVLQASHISQLQQRGIQAVSVEVEETQEEREERVARERSRILELFGEQGASPEAEQLRVAVLELIDGA